MAAIAFNYAAFIAAFPAFAQIPQDQIQIYWDMATGFVQERKISNKKLTVQTQYLNLMTAHLLAINALIAEGQTPGQITAATIDKVTVTLTPPPLPNQFQWWLGTTPYGQQLLALLQVNSVGGWYIGGSPVRSFFRGNGGCY